MRILAREREQQVLHELIRSGRPEFLAVYGRRRVGKTYLIKNYCEEKGVFFHITGVAGESTQRQLWSFNQVFVSVFNKNEDLPAPSSWQEAFHRLAQAVESHPIKGRLILFLDELPWLSTHKSGFVRALSYLWNRHLESDPRVLLIACGSAASWMIKNVIDSRGGLYNRLTRRLRLAPFDLHDTEIYLHQKGTRLSRKQVVEIYMALGGIPAYLDQVRPGHSSAQAISTICFDSQSSLYGEFDRLFRSLFSNSELHTRVIKILLKHKSGILQQDLFREAGIQSGSVRTRIKQDLIESGFIAEVTGFMEPKKGALIRLIDEYTLFYHSWQKQIAQARSPVDGSHWAKLVNGRSWRTWAGLAFEGICLTHSYQIASALGISGIEYTCSA
jgi:AAA+ ATPase superfamily predicted ATPase